MDQLVTSRTDILKKEVSFFTAQSKTEVTLFTDRWKDNEIVEYSLLHPINNELNLPIFQHLI